MPAILGAEKLRKPSVFSIKKTAPNDISNACLNRKVNRCLAPAGLKSFGKEKTSETEKVSEVFW
ncbi:MAG: hypothetical protein CMO05_07230 [Thalassospira sp.]|uniref:hypothetical protein n=1 Tax=Thalassospira sp. GB04J01 TaxID=1485225 RepID=UPI000C0F5AE0|nr:hypothetical protein [Thalassospira sp. GB04J01]MBV17253.1 hypothetical protein [Thalassospira sp.]